MKISNSPFGDTLLDRKTNFGFNKSSLLTQLFINKAVKTINVKQRQFFIIFAKANENNEELMPQLTFYFAKSSLRACTKFPDVIL